MKNSGRLSSEKGSILTFGIGISILVMLLVSVSVNIASLWSTKVTLRSIADGAALAGAQAVDESKVYQFGAESSVHLSPSAARMRVAEYVLQPVVKNRVHGLEIVSMKVVGSRVNVVLACQPQLAFGYLLPVRVSKIQASAVARQEIVN